ncbi:MAG: GNAT family N-acetyltransferase [Thermomicrobiales bacterium]
MMEGRGVTGTIRPASMADVPRMVELSEQKRSEYEQHQPVFWRKAADAAEKQTAYISRLVARDDILAFVYETDTTIDGFIIGVLMSAPPVFDPGGLTCLVDDFVVLHAPDWQTIGVTLLHAAADAAKERGAVQVVAVCGRHDEPKRAMLAAHGCSVASEWWVGAT